VSGGAGVASDEDTREAGEGDWKATLEVLGAAIRAERVTAGLSLRDLAERTKVSNAYLSQIERGLHQPSLRVLQAIAEALNIPADTLLAEAGVVSGSAAQPSAAHEGTEAAIRSDPDLKPEEREALLRIYRSFVEGRSSTA
jgi:transcriptional regulator with XRE-family HTH domain